MREHFIIIGTGKTPEGFEDYKPVTKNPMWLAGLKGKVNIHLHGEWWTIVTPQVLREMLLNLSVNPQPPNATVSY